MKLEQKCREQSRKGEVCQENLLEALPCFSLFLDDLTTILSYRTCLGGNSFIIMSPLSKCMLVWGLYSLFYGTVFEI